MSEVDRSRLVAWIEGKRGYQTKARVADFITEASEPGEGCTLPEALEVFLEAREIVRHDLWLRLDMSVNVWLDASPDPPRGFDELEARWTSGTPYLKLYEGPGVFPYGSALVFLKELPLDVEGFFTAFRNDPRTVGVLCTYKEYTVTPRHPGDEEEPWGVVTYMHATPYLEWRSAAGEDAGDDE